MPDQGPFLSTFYGWDVSAHPHPDNYDVYESFWDDCDACLGITNHIISRCVLLGADESDCIKHPIGVETGEFDAEPARPDDGPSRWRLLPATWKKRDSSTPSTR